jgi:predicted dehydrogenase
VKVAIIGYGSIGRRHLKNLLTLGVKSIVVVSAHTTEDTLNVNGESIPVVKDIEKVINSINMMIISNSSNLHLKYLRLAIKNNVHTYIEKPIACDLNQISNLSKQAVDKQLVVAVGMQFRFNKMLVKLKKRLDSNSFGRIISVVSSHGEHVADYHPGEDYRSSYAANKQQCGGVLLTQIHHIDYLNWLFGPFTNVYANEMASPSLKIDTDGVVNYSLVSSEKLQVHGHLNYLQRPKSTTLSVIGETGSAYWNYEKNTIDLAINSKNITEISSTDRNEMFLLAMRNFIESVKFSKKPESDLNDGIKSMEIVDSIKKSVSSGIVEKIN